VYQWEYFREENERAKSIVESFGIVYLDVDAQRSSERMATRGTTREGAMDCLHCVYHVQP